MNNSLIEPPFTPLWAREQKDNIFFIYNGASMMPLFKPGDLLCARRPAWGEVHIGDIVIVYRGGKANFFEHFVHRVVSVKRDYLITQGDGNLTPDLKRVTSNILVGLVISYNRQGQTYSVSGGYLGLFYARLILARNYLWWFLKRLGWRIYRLLRQSGWVNRIWQPAIRRVRVMTKQGPLIKYCHGSRTVAYWWPEVKKFTVVKPFDLVIPHPAEPK